MSGDAFRDHIQEVVDSYTYYMATQPAITPSLAATDIADAILTMSEMQAVKAALLSAKVNGNLDFMWWTLGKKAPSFLSWVLGDPS